MNLASMSSSSGETEPENEGADVVIRSYTSIGSLQAMGKIEIEAREAVIPDRRHVVYFVRVGLESMGDYPQSAGAMVNVENVPKLIKSLGKLSEATIKTDRFAFSEVEYEVDGLKFIVFNDGKGKTMFVVSVDNVSVHFNNLSRLDEIKNLIAKAQSYIDSRRIEF